MNAKTLGFLALAVSMLYGVGFTLVDGDTRQPYAAIGGVVVALMWIAVGVFGRHEQDA